MLVAWVSWMCETLVDQNFSSIRIAWEGVVPMVATECAVASDHEAVPPFRGFRESSGSFAAWGNAGKAAPTRQVAIAIEILNSLRTMASSIYIARGNWAMMLPPDAEFSLRKADWLTKRKWRILS